MLDRLAGNEAMKQHLQAALAGGKLAHSLLLCGEKGCGTGFAARCLAADYLYPQGGPAAEAVLAGQAPECLEVRGEGASGQIRIERIRQVREEVFHSALSAQGRVVLLYGTQNLNSASANALLKVLEEPPEGVLFLLTASSPAAVLATIRSRCAAYDLSPLPPAQCAAWLKTQRPACREAEFLAAVYEGSPGRCLAAVDDPEVTASLNAARQLAGLVNAGQEYEILVLLARYEKDKPGAFLLLSQFASLCAAALADPERAGLPAKAAGRCLYRVAAARKALEGNANTKLVLTNLGIRLARANR